MHDVRNYVQSLKYSIENILEILKFNDNSIEEIESSNKGQVNSKNKVEDLDQLDHNQKDNQYKLLINTYNIVKNNKTVINNIKNQEKKIQKHINQAIKQNKYKNLSKEKVLDCVEQKFSENGQGQIENYVLDLDISFENESIFQFEDIEINEEFNDNSLKDNEEIENIHETNNSQNLKFNDDIHNLIKYGKKPEEMINIIKFINQKINYLQHIDLTFQQTYHMNTKQIKPNLILSYISKILKILLINKNNQININMISKVNLIEIDIRMFTYLICYIVTMLHYKKKKQIELNINLDQKQQDKLDKRKYINQFINIEAIQKTELKPKKIKFSENQIFNNIIKNIGNNSNYKQQNFKDKNQYLFEIDYSSDESNEIIQPVTFDHSVSIKNDKIFLETKPNLFIFTEQSFSIYNGLILINVDDEMNIKSMHTMICARLDIQLLCCSNGRELVQTLAAVHSQLAKSQAAARVVVLLDHVLDGQTGLQVLLEAGEHARRFGVEVKWVLLSSTEDELTLDQQKKAGVELVVQKPLSVRKVKNVVEFFGSN